MNLYKIRIEVCGQKFQEESILGFLLAESDAEVYKYINDEIIYGGWDECSDEGGSDYSTYGEDESTVNGLTYREMVLLNKGTIGCEYNDYSDGYYGNKFYSWDFVKKDPADDDIKFLKTAKSLFEKV